jgi:hypothetical protein
LVCGLRPFLVDFRFFENFSAHTPIYACKWTSMVYQLYMAISWSILGLRTYLIDGKCCIFNEEKDDVFGLWSKTIFG